MKKFKRHRSRREIRVACRKAGFQYREGSSTCVSFTFIHKGVTCEVCYSTLNGRAFGGLKGVSRSKRFCSDSTEHENRPWFKALLDFIYVKKSNERQFKAAKKAIEKIVASNL